MKSIPEEHCRKKVKSTKGTAEVVVWNIKADGTY